MTPYYADDRATLYRGDALAVLRELPDASVDAVITDPPYSSGGMVRGDRNLVPSCASCNFARSRRGRQRRRESTQ